MFDKHGSVQKMAFHTCTDNNVWRNGEENRSTAKLSDQLVWTPPGDLVTKQNKVSFLFELEFDVVDYEKEKST